MSGADPLGTGHLTGLSAILWTLRSHGRLPEVDLLDVCGRQGLRAGAVPWTASLRRALDLKLLAQEATEIALTDLGRTLSELLDDLEPSDLFCQAIVIASVSRGKNERYLLAQARMNGTQVLDPRSVSSPLLDHLVDFGVLDSAATGQWNLNGSDFDPLLQGLMLCAPRGNPVAGEVGRIGELLSLRFYRQLGWQVFHASQISDAFGFDILCRRSGPKGEPSLSVESKATISKDELVIYLSPNELRVAQLLGARYELVVWGAVDPQASPDDNYSRLTALPYPLLIRDPVARIKASLPDLFNGLPIDLGRVAPDGIRWIIPAPTVTTTKAGPKKKVAGSHDHGTPVSQKHSPPGSHLAVP